MGGKLAWDLVEAVEKIAKELEKLNQLLEELTCRDR